MTNFHVDKCQNPDGCINRVDCMMIRKCKWYLLIAVPGADIPYGGIISSKEEPLIPPRNIEYSEQKIRHGSPTFYALLTEMADIHSSKSHDYASQDNPYGNYLFAGQLSKLFNSPEDSGFIGRAGEKLYRLANLENGGKIPSNESVEDTERDIATIIALWIAMRRDRRNK